MIRILAVAITAALVPFVPPAHAGDDVDVTPSRNIARLEATEQKRPGAVQEVKGADTRPPPSKVAECDQAPGARAAGLSCRITEFPGTFGLPPAENDATPGDIRRAIREVPMPPLKLRVQPDGRTLVNVDTIFYTEPSTMRRTVTLLGRSVRLECTPVRYTWVHGDGTTATTGEPGRPYPAKDVTHRYQLPGNDLRARVDTTYSVRYSVDGGPWTDLAELLTAPGPSTTIEVEEAVPVLTR